MDIANTFFKSRHILLGVTGGIAAYKSAELVRLLIKAGHTVQVVMTEAASQFITSTTLQALSGRPVMTDAWDKSVDNGMPHIALSRAADLVLIAPASADFMAKLAHGFANDLLSSLCLARSCPLMLAPAMNKQMWEHPATMRNAAQLRQDGVTLIGPAAGEQACGETGHGRMETPEAIVDAITTFFTPKILADKHILITAGATIEMIDPVRGITNLSSGKMGVALAQVATQMGAKVTLIYGQLQTSRPEVYRSIYAPNAQAMYQAVMQHIDEQAVMIAVAAVADYAPDQTYPQKIKKQSETLTLTLTRNPDILAAVANLPQPPFCVGFAAETEQVIAYAKQKRLAKNIPCMIANLAQEAFGQETNSVTWIDATGEYPLKHATKTALAYQLLEKLSLALTDQQSN